MKIFADTKVLASKIVDYGVFDNGIEWLIYDYIEGDLLSKVAEKLPYNDLKDIYHEMGRQYVNGVKKLIMITI